MAILAISGGGSGTSSGSTVAADSAGGAYVGGHFKGTVDFDAGTGVLQGTTPNSGYQAGFVAKYDEDGALEWLRTAGGASNGNATAVTGVAVDGDDDVVAVGWFSQTLDFDPGTAVPALTSTGQGFGAEMNHFVAKFDADGDLVWARTADGSSLNERAEDVAVDGNDAIYVVGSFRQTVDFDPGAGTVELVSTGTGPSQDQDLFVLKYDPDGNLLWAVSSGSSTLDESASAVAVDADGNVIVAGDFTGTVDFDPGPGTTSLEATGAYDQGNFFLAKYDADGDFRWAVTADDSSGLESVADVATDASGNIFLAGWFDGTLTLDGQVLATGQGDFVYNYFVAKYDPDGDLLWARTTGAFSYDDIAQVGGAQAGALSVDGDGSVYVSGSFGGTVDFDSGPGTLELVAPDGLGGATNHFTAKYNGDGKLIWVQTSEPAADWGSTGFEQAGGSDIRDGKLYLTGSHWGTVDFDPGRGEAIVDSGAGSGAHFLTIQNLPRTTPPAPTDPNDTVPPDAPTIVGFTDNAGNSSGHATTDRTLLIRGTAEPGTIINLYRTDPYKGELRIGTVETDADGNWVFDHTGTQLAIGTYRFWATATDAAGNESELSGAFTIAIERGVPWADFGGPGSIFYGHGFASDWVNGGSSADSIRGGAGDDTVFGQGEGDRLFGDNGNDWLHGNLGSDELHGGEGGDTVFGGQGSDRLYGDNGDDWLAGNRGSDVLEGAAGRDTLRGGQGEDQLSGGADDDLLAGDRGNDTMAGGAGSDRFLFAAESGSDRVSDFDPAADLLLIDLDAGGILNGIAIASAADLLARATDTADGVYVDLGGGHGFLLAGVTRSSLSADDFLLV
ncbi:Ig-like domain-containing protein [Stella sp.]|uniref:Ig-like domain-containing protein n=1 Tax=Stella sp. TaxID=2912054 RepID=UPI0035B315EE